MSFPISGAFTQDQIEKLNQISNDKANEERKASQELDKDAFLKLMMAQLQNQNPLEPVDNKEYMAQMAQFTSVEQLSNISKSMEDANGLNSLISLQLEELMKSFKENVSEEDSATLFQQNQLILDELIKLNQTLSTYFGGNGTEEDVEDQALFDLLDSK